MKTISIIIRGKHSEAHDPDLLEQHADVVLSDGSPYGFFGEGANFSARYGMFMDGVVYDYKQLQSRRPWYVNANAARNAGVVSTICTVRVEDEVAEKFDRYWRDMKIRAQAGKESFSLVGNNCSTHASDAFRFAGVLKEGISGLDTPQNLYHQLKMRYGANFRCASGFVGFTPEGNRLKLEIQSK